MARQTMGKEGAKFSSPSAKPASGKLVAKKNTAAGDPALQAKPSRSVSAPDKNGAAHTIKAKYQVQTEPAAGATQANGRILPPATKRSADSFGQGISTSM